MTNNEHRVSAIILGLFCVVAHQMKQKLMSILLLILIILFPLGFSLLLSSAIEKIMSIPVEETFSGVATLIALVVTVCIYVDQQKTAIKDKDDKYKMRVRDAAKLVVMQIDHAESVINRALSESNITPSLPKIIGESEWEKNKHLLVEHLKNHDLDLINKFFVTCEQLEETRKQMIMLNSEQLNEKARCVQRETSQYVAEKIKKDFLPSEYSQSQMNLSFEDEMQPFANRLDHYYLTKMLNGFNPSYGCYFLDKIRNENNQKLKGTDTYRELRRISQMN